MVELKNICKEYISRKKKTRALNNVNLTLGERGMVCLLGESGCGKTTLLNVLGALDSPSYGDILIDGKSLVNLHESERQAYRATQIGFIFQELNLIESLSVRDNLLLVCNKEDLECKHRETLQKLQIDEFADKLPKELSGGQRQRVAIARAIVKGSRILLCDEPTGSLDPNNAVMIFETLKEISCDRLVVVVSHDVATASKYADRIIRLHNGEVQSDTESEGESIAEQKDEHEEKMLAVAARPKTVQRMRGLFGLSARYTKKRSARSVVMLVLSVLVYLLLSVTSSMTSYSSRNVIAKSMIKQDERYFSVAHNIHGTKASNEEMEGELENIGFSDQNISEVESALSCSANKVYNFYVCKYGNLGDDLPQSAILSPGVYSANNCGITEIDSSFADTYGFTLYGRLPEVSGEVVLGGLAYQLYRLHGYDDNGTTISVTDKDDILGKSIRMQDEFLGERDFTVVGILDTGYHAERYVCTTDTESDTKSSTKHDEFNQIERGSVHNILYVCEGFYEQELATFDALDAYAQKLGYQKKGEYVKTSLGKVQTMESLPSCYYALSDLTEDDAIVLSLDYVVNQMNLDNILQSVLNDFVAENWETVRDEYTKDFGNDDIFFSGRNGYKNYILFKSRKEGNKYQPEYTYDYFAMQAAKPFVDSFAKENPIIEVQFNDNRLSSRFSYKKAFRFAGVFSNADYDCTYISASAWNEFAQDMQVHTQDVAFLLVPMHSVKAIKRSLRISGTHLALPSPTTFYRMDDTYNATYHYYELYNALAGAVRSTSRMFNTIAKVLRFAFLALALITVLVIYLYFSALIAGREKDVGVLYANGYTKGEIAWLFIFEALLVSAAIIVLSVILSAIGVTVCSHMFKKIYGYLFTPLFFTIKQAGIIIGFQLLFAALGILLPLLLLLRKKPMQIINAGK